MADIIDYLSEEELTQYRILTAKEALVAAGHPDIPVDEGIHTLRDAWEFLRTIQCQYEIDPEDSFDVRVYDGAIVRVSAE